MRKGGDFMNKTKEETKKCPSCDKDISIKAKRCPFCRQDLRSWGRRHPILTAFLIIITSPFWIAALVGFLVGLTGSYKNDATPTPERKKDLNVNVNFTGTQFVITNHEEFPCQNSMMEVNGGLFKGGYSMDGYILEAGQEYTVGAAQFTDKDGVRFNPFNIKPQSFSVSCRGNNELTTGIWYGEFN